MSKVAGHNKEFLPIFQLTGLDEPNIELVGGKAVRLYQLHTLGITIPDAFCVTTKSFEYFLESSELDEKLLKIISQINTEDREQLKAVSHQVEELIMSCNIPQEIGNTVLEAYHALGSISDLPRVAVRSSAKSEDLPQLSFAGQMVSFLNVKGGTKLLTSIKACWASLFSERAFLYRATNRVKNTDLTMGVIIQKMIDSEKSGVMFTIDPIKKDHNNILIEANFGLGETVVSGRVTPDIFVVDKQTLSLLEVKKGSKEIMVVASPRGGTIQKEVPIERQSEISLGSNMVKELAKIGIQIEKFYNYPQDIEWATMNGKIFILQTRHVTGLTKL